jgi:hypothetical protein
VKPSINTLVQQGNGDALEAIILGKLKRLCYTAA